MPKTDKPGGSLVRRLLQIDSALIAATDEIAEALEDGAEELPQSAMERIHTFAVEKAANVDRLVEWLLWMKAQVAFLKEREALLTSQRQRFEKAFSDVKASLATNLTAGATPKLQGEALKIWTQKNGQPSVQISHVEGEETTWVHPDDAAPGDGADIPPEFRDVRFDLRVPASGAAGIQDLLESTVGDFGIEIKTGSPEIATGRIREAIESGQTVPGAQLHRGFHLRHTNPKPPKVDKATAKLTEKI